VRLFSFPPLRATLPAGETMTYSFAFAILWSAWMLSWLLAALWASRAAARPPRSAEIVYWLLTVAGVALLIVNFRNGRLQMVWTEPGWADWVLFALAALGLGFTWWARLHLGTLWSGRVTRKAGHHVIDTGPYGLVRHPIYTGLLLAVIATALLKPDGLGLAGVALLVLGFVVKARLEERFLSEELGPDYAAYRHRVPMLVPFWPVHAG
jgi:protein-S-isoprenylcysteine O-methyltransferase Ste14